MKDGKMVRHDEFIYEKSVKASGSRSVSAQVSRLNAKTKECLRIVMSDSFDGIFNSQETNFKNAHKWADKKIELLSKYEEGGEEYFHFNRWEK